ncbi:MAG: N-acetylglutaminylglutamine synthetase [Gemmatimonadetes bacterium]|uniref:N-acetylglutaminylglutamine synthetase n=1 Tax=Candidatus Kutchimonas denitrificans TaxID=3056748 RepID=A0AAE4Z9Z4_9BACT|nr:N-acetylglutaminylglutamine synthetase [Gemmatimonadota bacterium]NIR74261.1 N-acetylglutaminylglutamine synthetase [Candidatus Kutchimonas denitrificans]NIS02516.1 N-acetylglutaminylglutamine synthetase [Gemmatimonadota bacterium]NIT68392.1 N-acetylglutaminylglutamine synthetase [Gemmatimonadota bacterium]NIU51844.1 N-acetylglutaminylglutamine synthetase [Gemmatimonadota bacterium]
MSERAKHSHRLDRASSPSLRNWEKPAKPIAERMASDVAVEMGWGRLIFGHTFDSNENLAEMLCDEAEGQRDIALYLRDPHVVLSYAPQELFLDPSHTYRLWSYSYRPTLRTDKPFITRRLRTLEDAEEVNRIYAARHMATCDPAFMADEYATRLRTYLVAESKKDGQIIGTVTGVDHVEAFDDPENGSSLWTLAVDPQAAAPGVGEALVRHLVEHYFARGRAYNDLSVMHDNREAIRLYEKLGYQRVPVFCVKHKNAFNESLFAAPPPDAELNPYARIIIDEARRRGVVVEILDEEFPIFRLTLGGRSITCRESLTDLTTAMAFCRCDDKRLTHRVLAEAELRVPSQTAADGPSENQTFLQRHGTVVVKPARGEQGAGVSVDVRSGEELEEAVTTARQRCEDVIIEEFVEGQDLRVIVIGDEVVAAAVRRPPEITGTGDHTISKLIEKYNRRRLAATGGESRVPLDDETKRCVRSSGYDLETVLPAGEVLKVRKTANLHLGGTIHDVTDQIHPALKEASVAAAQALEIPVVGLDLAVPDLEGPDYWIIEANERPGLANHEPQPTAERFIDLLFPQTATA